MKQPMLASIQGSLALSFVEQVPQQRTERALHAVPTTGTELDRFAQHFAHALVEVVAGNRGPQQLMRWCSASVYSELVHRCATIAKVAPAAHRRRRLPMHLHRVRVFCPSAKAAEISIVAKHGQRYRAIAARIEHNGRRWTCTALQFG